MLPLSERVTHDHLSSVCAANWNGFHDGECGIHGYTWALGTSVCGSDVSDFVDPHTTLPNAEDWPNVGIAKGLDLAEGPYYVTVQVR